MYKTEKKSFYDIIVIGGGAGGLMAAVTAAANGAKTLLLEKNEVLGKKLSLTGGGRCNLTNSASRAELMENIPINNKFLYSSLALFDNESIMNFFIANGVDLKCEDGGRVFPASETSLAVIELFIKKLKQHGVSVKTKQTVTDVLPENGGLCCVKTEGEEIYYAAKVIIACGGKSFPNTGSTGDGYVFLSNLGHKINPLYAAEVPIKCADILFDSRELMGLSLSDAALSVYNGKNRKIVTHRGDLVFTHFGISGPIALRCSGFVNKVKQVESAKFVALSLDLSPDKSKAEILSEWMIWTKQNPEKEIKSLLRNFVPDRFAKVILKISDKAENSRVKQLNPLDFEKMADHIKNFKLKASGTFPIERAFITAGGVSTKEINPKTMESKLIPGIYVCGELLDVSGYTGGYNLTIAFSTGYTAGFSAAGTQTERLTDV